MSPGDGTAAHQPIRRCGRIVRRIAILLSRHDEEGNTFTERTHTVVLSVHGAGILSTHRFAPEQQLILRVEETNREAVVRVVGEIATERKSKGSPISRQSLFTSTVRSIFSVSLPSILSRSSFAVEWRSEASRIVTWAAHLWA